MNKPPTPKADNLRRMREARYAQNHPLVRSRAGLVAEIADAVQRSADAHDRKVSRRAARKARQS